MLMFSFIFKYYIIILIMGIPFCGPTCCLRRTRHIKVKYYHESNITKLYFNHDVLEQRVLPEKKA